MISSYLKVALRNLMRHRLYTLINVAGLSLGIACCIIIFLFVQQEYSYDMFHKNLASLYRVTTELKRPDGEVSVNAFEPMPLVPALKAEIPEVLYGARFSTGGTIISRGDRVFTETVLFTDPDAFRMFDIHFLEGSPAEALQQPNDIVITQTMARKYFGGDDALGQQLSMRTRQSTELYTVVGVVEPMPANSSLRFEFLANMSKHAMYDRAKERWTSSNGSAFVQLAPGASKEAFEAKMRSFAPSHFMEIITAYRSNGGLSDAPDAFVLTLQPMASIHLDRRVQSSPEERGNATYSMILAAIGLLVLTVASINFVTLTIGRSANRAKEVGIRKVLGAFRNQLVRQFWGEALFLCTAALLLGIVLAELFLPAVNQLFGKQLSLNFFANPVLIAGFLGLLLLVGLLAGAYPALLLSRFEPVQVLKGKFRVGGQNRFTRLLVVFQFALSIFLICVALLLSEQTRFLVTKSLGFRAEQVVVIPAHAGNPAAAGQLFDRFKARVEQHPGVLNLSITSGAFTHGYDINGFQYNGKEMTAYVCRVDEEYLETLGIPLRHGRNFIKGSAMDRDHAIIVNDAFLRMVGWSEPAVGRSLAGSGNDLLGNAEVIGVVSDFHFVSLREEIPPLVLFMNPQWTLDDILVRIAPADIPRTMDFLRAAWKEAAPATPFNATFLDEDFQHEYDLEMKWGRIINAAAGIAIFLACLGLFGLATLAVTNRTREIGIRKVLGATGTSVLGLISGDFLKLVVLANLLAWPAAYLAGSRYLEDYAYRISLNPWPFLLSGLGALAIAFLVIAGQIMRAVRANPAEALHYE